MSRMLRTATLLLPLLLVGCAALHSDAPPQAAGSATRNYQHAIDLGGRLSVRYEMRHGEEAVHGSFQWQQTPAQTSVTLLSPLGQTVARIGMTPSGAALERAGQPIQSASDVDILTADTLGWPLPVAGLRDWLQGFGTDINGNTFVANPQSGPITTRDGWQLHYPAWQNDDAGTARPRRIDLSRRTEQAGEVAIRIVIDTWQPQRP